MSVFGTKKESCHLNIKSLLSFSIERENRFLKIVE